MLVYLDLYTFLSLSIYIYIILTVFFMKNLYGQNKIAYPLSINLIEV